MLFFQQPWVQKFSYHVMIFLGESQLVALAGCPRIRPVDQVCQVGDQPFPDGPVPLGLPGVVADGEPLGPRTTSSSWSRCSSSTSS